MAASLWKCCQKVNCTLLAKPVTLVGVRYSRYDTSYMEPSVDIRDLNEGLHEDDLRQYRPIKAATPEQTSSLNYDPLLAKFIRQMTKRGDKVGAQRAMNNTFERMKYIQLGKYHKAQSDAERNRIELNVRKIFHDAVENCKPLVITRQISRGGVLFTVPVPVTPQYAVFQSIKWLVEAGKNKDGSVHICDTLSNEFINAANNEGKAVKKKQDLHRIAEDNRAYAHYRWMK